MINEYYRCAGGEEECWGCVDIAECNCGIYTDDGEDVGYDLYACEGHFDMVAYGGEYKENPNDKSK